VPTAPNHTVLVTGATDGLGLEIARRLAASGVKVLAHGRSEEKLGRVVSELGDNAEAYLAELGSLEETRTLAQKVAAEHAELDILINNAGVATMERQTSADGYELDFAVNYLSHFLITLELLPVLRKTDGSRIVNVSSIGQAAIDFDDVMLEGDGAWNPGRAYSQSKLAQILFTIELAERLPAGDSPSVNALHPSTYMDTNMVRGMGTTPISTVDAGAEATLRLAVGDNVDGITGRFYNVLEESDADPQAYDADERRRLWQLSAEITGLDFERT
jgi:NAD(P)-dependent dehydrogenase (short-subunit alcohol dehydrogenase family)